MIPNWKFKLLPIFSLIILFADCHQRDKVDQQVGDAGEIKRSDFKYTTGFSVAYHPGYKVVTVHRPWQNATKGIDYILVPKGAPRPDARHDAQIIEVPVENMVVTSTTHIPLLYMLDESEKLIGFPNTDLISSEEVRRLVDRNHIKELGMGSNLNLEALVELQPSMVMAFTMGPVDAQYKKIQEMNIPVVINADYLETDPLGRAEWIKFAALFLDKEKEADSIFDALEKNYLHLQNLVEKVEDKPAVITGVVYSDTWYMPGGKSWASIFFQDAGGHYPWSTNKQTGSIPLSFEQVYDVASGAPFWIGAASYQSLRELAAADSRYTAFEAYQQNNVYTYNKRMGAKGGNEFLELGYMRPDIILADLVKIMHPEMLPDHTLFFYRKLDAN